MDEGVSGRRGSGANGRHRGLNPGFRHAVTLVSTLAGVRLGGPQYDARIVLLATGPGRGWSRPSRRRRRRDRRWRRDAVASQRHADRRRRGADAGARHSRPGHDIAGDVPLTRTCPRQAIQAFGTFLSAGLCRRQRTGGAVRRAFLSRQSLRARSLRGRQISTKSAPQ